MYFILNIRRILYQSIKLLPSQIWLFVFLMIIISSTAIAQWSMQSPIPTSHSISGIGAPTSSRVFIATDNNSFDNTGSLFESTDGGNNWIPREVPVGSSSPFYGLFFLDSQNGWLYGNENYKTTDGGTNWTQLPFLGSTYFMKFYSSNFGLATGNFGQYISRDGGLSWDPSPNDMFSFDFIDDQIGLGVSANGIYKTTDAGLTFTIVKTGFAEAIKYLSSAIVVGVVDSMFVRSTDGGENWITGNSAEGRNNFVKVSDEVVLAYGRAGTFPDYDDRIFRSTDGGQTWNDLGEIMNVSAYSGSLAFAVTSSLNIAATDGAGNMFHSNDAGLNWVQVFTAPGGVLPSYLSSAIPFFADAQTGYFGYGPGFIIKTTDAGASWFQVSSGSGNSINDMDRFANGDIIAVGENGTILRKANGSSRWSIQTSVTQTNFKAIQIIGTSDAVAVDDAGKIFTSTDGGINWTGASSSPQDLLTCRRFTFYYIARWLGNRTRLYFRCIVSYNKRR